MTFKIISYHANKSSGLGGIETLIRSFHKVSEEMNVQFIEVFHAISGEGKEIFINNQTKTKYVKIPLSKLWKGEFRELVKAFKFSLFLLFNSLKFNSSKSNAIILYHPNNLLFIFKFMLKNKRLILVQSNKLDTLFQSKIAKCCLKKKLHLISKFVVYTEADRDKLQSQFNFDQSRISIIPRGCKLPTKERISEYSKRLVTVARIDEKQKNFSGMVNIVSKLPAGYSLDIFGTGTAQEIDDLKRIIHSYPNITYRGKTTDVAKTLSDYSVFLMTSHFEGFGQTIIEARSQGLPVVLYNTFEAANWVTKDGITGFVVDYENEIQFVDKIVHLTSSKQVYSEFSNNSLSIALETDLQAITVMWKHEFIDKT